MFNFVTFVVACVLMLRLCFCCNPVLQVDQLKTRNPGTPARRPWTMNFQITNGLMPTTSQFPNPLVPSATSSGSNFVATIRHCPLGPCPPTPAPHLEHITPSLARSARGSRLSTASWAYAVNSVNQYRTGKGQNHLDDEADVSGYGNQ